MKHSYADLIFNRVDLYQPQLLTHTTLESQSVLVCFPQSDIEGQTLKESYGLWWFLV